jgi:hypothetical protein
MKMLLGQIITGVQLVGQLKVTLKQHWVNGAPVGARNVQQTVVSAKMMLPLGGLQSRNVPCMHGLVPKAVYMSWYPVDPGQLVTNMSGGHLRTLSHGLVQQVTTTS